MAGTFTGFKLVPNGDDHDLYIYQGKTLSMPMVLKSAGAAIDVTGYSARMHVRKKLTSSDTLAEFTVANSRVTIGTTNGLITISMTAADSAALVAGEGVYDLEIVEASGAVRLSMSGRCFIIGEVTR